MAEAVVNVEKKREVQETSGRFRCWATKIVHVYQVSFGNKHEAVEVRNKIYGGSWRENVEESCCLLFDCYGIKTKVPHLYPTCVIFSSSKKNLGTFCFESMFCRLETTKRAHTSIFALLCLLQGIARVKFYCFACQVCREISQVTSSLLFWPRETRSSTRFSITASRYLMHASFEDRDSKETVNLHLSGTVAIPCKFNRHSAEIIRNK